MNISSIYSCMVSKDIQSKMRSNNRANIVTCLFPIIMSKIKYLGLLCAVFADLTYAETECSEAYDLILQYREINVIDKAFGSEKARSEILKKHAPVAWFAAYRGYREILGKLAELGDDLGEKSVDGDNVLWAACLQDDEEVISFVMKKRPDLLEIEEGIPWLWAMVSANRNHADLIDEMLKQRDHIYGFSGVLESIWRDEPYLGMYAVLHYGKTAQDVAMANWLMRRGAVWQTPEGEDQYEKDITYLKNRSEFATMIIGGEGDASTLKDEELRGLIQFVVGTVAELKEQFVAWKLPLERRLIYGRTPLLEAMSINRKDVAKALLALGADVRAKDEKGHHILYCNTIDESLIRQVLEIAPELLDERDESGRTAAEHIVEKTPFPPIRENQRGLRNLDCLLSLGAELPKNTLERIWEQEDTPNEANYDELEKMWGKIKKSEVLEKHGYKMNTDANMRYQRWRSLYYKALLPRQ